MTVWNSSCSDTSYQTLFVSCGVTPVCDASFTWFPDSTCGVYFNNTSTGGTFPSYFWDFGDGNISYQTNPNHLYANPGSYTVTLSMSDSSGNCFDSFTQIVQVNCGLTGSCVSDFGWYVDTTGSGCSIQFYDLSTGSGLSYYWDFGDGNWTSLANPSHTYGASGSYTVGLTVWNNITLCSDTTYQLVTVNCASTGTCIADFNWSPDPSSGCTINFTNNSSGAVFPYYFWDFGDGNYAYQANPSHTYASSGSYTVVLTMTDSLGVNCVTSYTQVVQANCTTTGSCVSDFGWYVDTTGSGCSIQFYDLSTGSGLNYSWSFGDGGWSSSPNPSHTYATSGTYAVSMTVWNSTCSDTSYQTIFVSCGIAPACDASFNWYADSACNVYFNNTSTGGVFPTYFWDFGDGNISYQTNPTHTYANPGSYTVVLTMSDSSGNCFDAFTQIVQVNCGLTGSCVSDFGWYVDTTGSGCSHSIL